MLMLYTLLVLVQTGHTRFLYFFTDFSYLRLDRETYRQHLVSGFLGCRLPRRTREYSTLFSVRCHFLRRSCRLLVASVRHLRRERTWAPPRVTPVSRCSMTHMSTVWITEFTWRPAREGPSFKLRCRSAEAKAGTYAQGSSKIVRGIYDSSLGHGNLPVPTSYPFTTEQLIDRVAHQSRTANTIRCCCDANRRSQTMLRAAWELYARRSRADHSSYTLPKPGAFHIQPRAIPTARYTLAPFGPAGLIFWPALPASRSRRARAKLPPRAVREGNPSIPHLGSPHCCSNAFHRLQSAWLERYLASLWLIVAGFHDCCVGDSHCGPRIRFRWIRRLRLGRQRLLSTSAGRPVLYGGLTASIVMASLVFGYNAAVTSIFAEPDFRYRQMADLQAILLAGLGLVALYRWLSVAFSARE